MKRLFNYIGFLTGGAMLLAGCQADTTLLEPNPVIAVVTLDITSQNPLYSAQNQTLRYKTAGGTVDFMVATNADAWSCSNSNESWLSIEKNEYDGTLKLTVSRNEASSEPKAEVVVTAGSGDNVKTTKILVTQNAAGSPEITAVPNVVEIASCGQGLVGSTTVETNYEDWEFTQSCNWMLVERQDNQLIFTAEVNNTTLPRETEVKLTAGYGDKQVGETVVVRQDGKAYINSSPAAITFDYTGGESKVTVTSNYEWTYASDAAWLSVAREGDVLTVTVAPYDGELRHTGHVTLTTGTGENTDAVEIIVSQTGVSDKYLTWTYEVPADNTSVTAFLAGEVDARIDWGDNTPIETVTAPYPKHTYALPGTYSVMVDGKVTELNSGDSKVFNETLRDYVTSVKQWGQTGLTSMANALYYCKKLKSIPGDTAHSFDKVTSFERAFDYCQSLEAIPAGLFDNAVNCTDFSYTFDYCRSIAEIPAKLFHYNTEATDFRFVFNYAGTDPGYRADGSTYVDEGLLTKVPADLFATNVKAEYFSSAFGYTAIRLLPGDLFQHCPKVVDMKSCFVHCEMLEAIPVGLFAGNPEVENFSAVFSYCYKAASIPQLLFFNNLKAANFRTAFIATAITTVPAGLFDNCTNVTDFFGVFQKCPNLRTLPNGLFAKAVKCTTFERLFTNCTSLVSVPGDLFANCGAVTKLTSMFEGCTSLQSIPGSLFRPFLSATAGDSVFKGCTSLKSVPAGLFVNGTYTTFSSIFDGCTELETLPAGLFADCGNVSASGFGNALRNCAKLKAVPADLFGTQAKATTFSNTFYGCASLEAVPEELFSGCALLSSLSSTFYGCTGLKSLPAGLFDSNKKISNVKNAFQNCSALTGESPCTVVSGAKVHLYERSSANGFTAITNSNATDAFAGCTGLSDYGILPDAWK